MNLKSKILSENEATKSHLFLLCVFAFLLSFEHLLWYTMGIKTIFKPYRIVGILIIMNTFYSGVNIFNIRYKNVRWLLIFFAYGYLFTGLLYILDFNVSLSGVFNDLIQILLNLLIFITILAYTYKDAQYSSILRWFVFGVLINSIYMFYLYFGSGYFYTRSQGFMDGPNIAAMSATLATVVLLYFNNIKVRLLWFVSNYFLIAMMVISILSTGSRTGLITYVFIVMYSVFFKGSLSARSIIVPFIIMFSALLLINIFGDETTINYLNSFFSDNGAIRRIENVIGNDIRFVLWESGWNAIKSSYFMGIGIAQYRSNFELFREYTFEVDYNFVLDRVAKGDSGGGLGLHSLYVETMVESGIIGIVLLMNFFYLTFIALKLDGNKLRTDMRISLLLVLLISLMAGRLVLSGIFWICLFIIIVRISERVELTKE